MMQSNFRRISVKDCHPHPALAAPNPYPQYTRFARHHSDEPEHLCSVPSLPVVLNGKFRPLRAAGPSRRLIKVATASAIVATA